MIRLLHILALTVAAVASYYAVAVALTDGNPVAPIVVAVLALGVDVFVEDWERRRMAAGRAAVWRRRIEETDW